MKSQPTLQQLQEERRSLLASHRCLYNNAMEEKKKLIAGVVDKLLLKAGNTYTLLDLHCGRLTHHFAGHAHSLNYPAIDTTQQDNLHQSLRLFHEEDYYGICDAEIKFYRMIMSLQEDGQKEVNLVSLRRLRNNNGNYDIYLMRAFVIECDDVRTPWLLMIEMEYLFRWETEVFYPHHQLLVTNKRDKSILQKINLCSVIELTKQQKEILLMSIEGKSVKVSAERQSIAESTVKSHRNELIRRLNATSMHNAKQVATLLYLLDTDNTNFMITPFSYSGLGCC